MRQIPVSEAAKQLPELIAAVISDETIYLVSDNQQIVELVYRGQHRPRFGSAKGLVISIADDFDAPLDDFAEYME
jgi:antitoxin (DNA-binding transcriptional repressor) of toxin-antitoxin stability system